MSDYNAESGLDGLRFNWLGNLQITNTHHAPMPFRLPSVESAPGYQMAPMQSCLQASQSASTGLISFCQSSICGNTGYLLKQPQQSSWIPGQPSRCTKMLCIVPELPFLKHERLTPSSAVMQELSQWLSQLPTQWEKSLMTCTPADLIAFLQDHWLEALAGTTLPDGSLIDHPVGSTSACPACPLDSAL